MAMFKVNEPHLRAEPWPVVQTTTELSLTRCPEEIIEVLWG